MEQEYNDITQRLEMLSEKYQDISFDKTIYNNSIHMDLCEIKNLISNLEECIETVQEYTSNANTNYEELWEKKKHFAEQVQKAREAWMRTEIFSYLLNS
jgi:chromosome segregation ATPase